MEKAELICLADSAFLQYMQYVWSYYEVNDPSGICETDAYHFFLQALTALERALLRTGAEPDAPNNAALRQQLTDCYQALVCIAPIAWEPTTTGAPQEHTP